MRRGQTIAFYALMWSLTAAACVAVAGLYFGYKGAALPMIPVRLTGDWLIEGDDEIGFVPIRNGSTEMRHLDSGLHYHVFTDRRRARVNAPGVQTPDHVDVLAVGCSFTWGTGVESEDTYPQQLGQILDVPVANFGMGSYGSVQSFQTLLRNLDLKPKVIVYGFIQDHLRRNLAPCAPNYVPYCLPVSYLQRRDDWITLEPPHMEYFSPTDNRAFMTEVSMRDPTGPVAWLLRAKWAAKMDFFKYRHSDTVAVDGSPETAALALRVMIEAMAKEAHDIGARFVVLNMPYLRRGHVQSVSPELASAVEGKDLTFVDFSQVAADYYDRDPTGTLILGDDPHPNPVAHRMIAETLAPAIRPWLAPDAAAEGIGQ
jgi:hypothetical protein